MARPYAQEMARLAQTLAWATAAHVEELTRAVATAALGPLVAVGSGGSLSAAHFLAQLHQRESGELARTATPSEVTSELAPRSASFWLLSAGGGNVDINKAFEETVLREPRQLAVLCGRDRSPLAMAARRHPYTDLLIFEPPAGKDGFLATNSLLGFAALLTRSYLEATDSEVRWGEVQKFLEKLISGGAFEKWQEAVAPVWSRSTTIVLHGTAARVGAIDLESKFTEAALGNLHYADWRNFAHGRHHWLAKRADTSAIIAFICEEDASLAERTLAHIPPNVPIARIELPGTAAAVALGSLVASLQITGWAGEARNIDPGQPGVPEFGRKLYNLRLAKRLQSAQSTEADLVAIERKSGASYSALGKRGQLKFWRDAYDRFEGSLRESTFVGLVLDYDGTIVDARARFSPPSNDISEALVALLDRGVALAIATGRGKSVRNSLRKAIPQRHWSNVMIGYYNGLEIGPLSDDNIPNVTACPSPSLAAIAAQLRRQPEVALCAQQTDRAHQITLEPRQALGPNHLWLLAQQAILTSKVNDVQVVKSSHSIDIIDAKSGKGAVVEALRKATAGGPILCIGDRGRWPGNDYELLSGAFALSVDEVNLDPATCWHLGSPGSRGPSVLLDYLRRIQIGERSFRWE